MPKIVHSLSQDNYDTPVTVMLTTRTFKLDGEANFILLHRALQRCKKTTKDSVYAGFYVFGSNDLHSWQLMTGTDRKTGEVTDILATRAHLEVKYYIFLFAVTCKLYDAVNSRKINNFNNEISLEY